MAEESVRPGTCRSKVGVEAMEEPCTNRIVPMVLAGSPAYFSNMNRRTSLPLLVQCSSPRTGAETSMVIVRSLLAGLSTIPTKHAALRRVDHDADVVTDIHSL